MARVLRGRSLSQALEDARGHPERALVFELAHGAIRRHPSLLEAIDERVRRPLKDPEVRAALLIGAYQLRHTRIPPHAAVSETVDSVRALGKTSAARLVNAVLRAIARAPPAPRTRAAALDHPDWLIERVRADWGGDAEAILRACNEPAPMALRVNVVRSAPDAYADALARAGFPARPGRFPETLVLGRPMPRDRLPGFAEGLVSVQDENAQLAAHLVGAAPGERVLDACAAPGGKALHIAELAPGARLEAIDIDEAQSAFARSEAERLGHAVEFRPGDASRLDWWDGVPFDRVLLDAPCSGTGTLRRRPDIKLLRRPEDLPRQARAQAGLLDSLWRTLRRGGTLLYCTCSILAQENDDVIASFLERTADAQPGDLGGDWGRPTGLGRQTLPSPGAGDGFYFARLVKR